ncbi:MAG: type VI secretion system tip protein VgrG [Deltaproteobacteria bacterium]|nr:type VI secretion system tip protein VgrG [Nannocystaceae bacterium]
MADSLIEIAAYHFAVEQDIGDGWQVRRFALTESLSRPFSLQLDVLTPDLETDTEALLGASCDLAIDRGPLHRSLAGIIEAVEYIGVTHGLLMVRLEIVPAFALLRHNVDSRIFQGSSVVEVVREVLEAGLGAFGRKLDADNLAASYEQRDYCVQFGESTFDFVSRLLEDEGITYRFEYDEDSRTEVLVLGDANTQYADASLIAGDDLPIIADRHETADRESLQVFDFRRVQTTDKVTSRAFNWKAPGAIDEATHNYAAPRGRTLERYEHGVRRRIVDDPSDDAFDGTTEQRLPMATRRLEMYETHTKLGRGRSNATALAPGRVFTLGAHPRADLDGARFLVTKMLHSADCPGVEAGSDGAAQYSNAFECIPLELPYRPECVTPRPKVYGPQTAIVTGPAGEEIHTDKHGRIKVWFPWDRLQEPREHSSCWVRTSQSLAGKGFGGWFLPRVGMEVVVQFLDGNPDRPVVTGCVYDGDNALPYPMPDDKTKSTIKSQSSPGGDGFNEVRFEDAKGLEEIWIHAQKDLNIKVLNDNNTNVDIHQNLNVGGNQTVVIEGNQTVTVKGDPAQPSGGGGGGGGGGFKGSSTDVTGDYSVKASATVFIGAPDSITLECPGSSIKLEPGKITLTAGGGATIVLDANALMQSAAGSKVVLDGSALAQSVAGSSVLLDGNACTTSSGGSKVLLDGNALVSAAAGASALYDANATITGAEATLTSKSGGTCKLTANADLTGAVVTCQGGGAGTVTCDGGGVTLGGPSITSAADGVNAISGATVTLN